MDRKLFAWILWTKSTIRCASEVVQSSRHIWKNIRKPAPNYFHQKCPMAGRFMATGTQKNGFYDAQNPTESNRSGLAHL